VIVGGIEVKDVVAFESSIVMVGGIEKKHVRKK
jgi:hypothetical protein